MSPLLRKYLPMLLAALMMASLSACHSSKQAVSTSKGQVSTAKTRTDYKTMRREVEAMKFSDSNISSLISEAASWIGTPYRYGGKDRDGTDCSGFVMQVFKSSLGENVPRSSREQYDACFEISYDELLPGDLVFFATGSDRSRVSHVGLFIGNGEMIHSSSSRGVIVSDLNQKYWAEHFHSYGRPSCIDNLYANAASKRPAKETKEQAGKMSSSAVSSVLPQTYEQASVKAPEPSATISATGDWKAELASASSSSAPELRESSTPEFNSRENVTYTGTFDGCEYETPAYNPTPATTSSHVSDASPSITDPVYDDFFE